MPSLRDYEAGRLSKVDTLQMFADLIKSGDVWNMSGHYTDIANRLIDREIISNEGEIFEVCFEA